MGWIATVLLLSLPLDVTLAQSGSCQPGQAETILRGNIVRALILNNGAQFWRPGRWVSEIPDGGGVNVAVGHSLTLGGFVDGELRTTAARELRHEFWPGPLDPETGAPPIDCSVFDRVYRITRNDLESFEDGAAPSADLREWPTGLGAPTVDAAGLSIDLVHHPLEGRATRTIDLDAGERPLLVGDEMVWWIMNDLGNEHQTTSTAGVGVEVHGTAFAFDQPEPLGAAIFFRHRIIYRGESPLESAYVGYYHDPFVGSYDDDYLGIDTTRSMTYSYNATNSDSEYGTAPPALGLDLVQGPQIGGQRLPFTGFVSYLGCGTCRYGEPQNGLDFYNQMRGLWKDGSAITEGERGFTDSGPPTRLMYAGDPVTGAFWSEVNADGQGNPNPPAYRWYQTGSGPFTMRPGDEQEVIVSMVWARGQSNLESIVQLRRASDVAQAVADAGFDTRLPSIDPPSPVVAPSDGALTISWSNPSSSNNATESFAAFTPVVGATYAFEGYEVLRFDSATDSVGQVVATFDLDNGVTRVLDVHPDSMFAAVVVDGTDSGILQRSLTIGGLDNYRTYHFGVRSYAFQDGYYPKVIKSAVARVSAEPMPAAENPNMGDAMAAIGIVPNPYYGESEYEVLGGDREVRITNVPEGSVVRVFTLSGSLVRELRQEGVGVVRWDLRNHSGRRLTGGTYLVHVEGPTGQRRRVLKFVMVRAR